MKIKDWIDNIAKLGDENMVIGELYINNGIVHMKLTLATDEINDVMYDATSKNSGN